MDSIGNDFQKQKNVLTTNLWTVVYSSVVKNIDISISIDTEISERYQY